MNMFMYGSIINLHYSILNCWLGLEEKYYIINTINLIFMIMVKSSNNINNEFDLIYKE